MYQWYLSWDGCSIRFARRQSFGWCSWLHRFISGHIANREQLVALRNGIRVLGGLDHLLNVFCAQVFRLDRKAFLAPLGIGAHAIG